MRVFISYYIILVMNFFILTLVLKKFIMTVMADPL